MEKIAYLVVGDNNFWYTTTEPITKEELKETIHNLTDEIHSSEYVDEPYKPNQVYLYPLHPTVKTKVIDLNNVDDF
jgi:hypothetical protein